jgi:hypothetical protein
MQRSLHATAIGDIGKMMADTPAAMNRPHGDEHTPRFGLAVNLS